MDLTKLFPSMTKLIGHFATREHNPVFSIRNGGYFYRHGRYGRSTDDGTGSNAAVQRAAENLQKQLAMNLGIPFVAENHHSGRINVYGVSNQINSVDPQRFREYVEEVTRFANSPEGQKVLPKQDVALDAEPDY